MSDWRRRSVGGIRGATENEFSNGRYGTGAVFARRRIVQYSMGIQISRARRPAGRVSAGSRRRDGLVELLMRATLRSLGVGPRPIAYAGAGH